MRIGLLTYKTPGTARTAELARSDLPFMAVTDRFSPVQEPRPAVWIDRRDVDDLELKGYGRC